MCSPTAGAVALCRRYNAELAKLSQLAESVRAGQITSRPRSPTAEAHRELDGLGAMIASPGSIGTSSG